MRLGVVLDHQDVGDGLGEVVRDAEDALHLAEDGLFAVVDVRDALRYDRSYRAGWSSERVRAHLAESAGAHFDPQVVPIFLRILERDGEPVFADYPNGR